MRGDLGGARPLPCLTPGFATFRPPCHATVPVTIARWTLLRCQKAPLGSCPHIAPAPKDARLAAISSHGSRVDGSLLAASSVGLLVMATAKILSESQSNDRGAQQIRNLIAELEAVRVR